MSSQPTVPMIAPDGTTGDIPANRVAEAIAAGGKTAVVMTAPDGTMGYIPHDRVMDAIKAGGRIGQPSAQEGYKAPDAQMKDPTGIMRGQESIASDVQQLKNLGGAAVDQLKATGETVWNSMRHPIDSSPIGMIYNADKFAIEHKDNPATASDFAGQIGIDIPGAKQAYAAGNIPSAVQKVVNPVAQAFILKKVGEALPGAVPERISSAPEKLQAAIARTQEGGLKYGLAPGPQVTMARQIADLPPKAVNAAEGIFQAAAPTGTNTNFRKALYTALPDLAEVARKVNLDEAKGGIINPDMRIGKTVEAIDAHLQEMYKTELKPQIDAHAGETVKPELDYDAKAGLRFLSKSAGQVGDRFIAAKAANGQPMTVAELDRLRFVTNQELTPLRNMTPQDRAMAQVTNKKLAGLEALDSNVGDSLNNYLQAQGEPGIKGYEQRYAALSKVRDGLRPRINAEELKRNLDLGIVGKGIKAVTGGKSGIASASQAAVADVNVGKKLQTSMKSLAESNLMPNRAIRQASPMSSQSLPEQSQ